MANPVKKSWQTDWGRMSGGFWYCQKTSLPSPFCNSSLSIALLTPLPVTSWWPEHEGAICHTVLIPARVLRARHSPLTRLGCHVCWLTGKVTSGDKRPQLESVTNLPSLLLFPLLSDFYTKNLLAISIQTAFRELTCDWFSPFGNRVTSWQGRGWAE